TFIMEDARNIGFAVNIVLIIKAFERIGEHAQNLAEYVLYQVAGTDVRHQAEHQIS
ncbi:MAG: phosphate transport system regulator PhoU, partial [Gammaproteobacteria bacterium]|nr:phosphate transport system regulator PhoU [Gammaproteobacteria bacterium]